MHRLIAICSLLLLLTCVGCSTLGFPTTPVAHTLTAQTKQVLNSSPRHPAVPRELAKRVLSTHYLEAGDELLIESNNIDSDIRIPADQRVAADGSVDLGKYGRVKVASLTLEQAEERIQSAIGLIDEKPASINVRLIQSVQKFYVIGEVNSPGAYPLTGHETVLDGIVVAGGLTSRASACDLLLARPTDPCSCRVTLPVCYRAITQLGDTTTNYQLKSGDRIFVGRQTLLEELTQCCFSDKGCDRCSKEHRACCDPLVAEHFHPSFESPAIESIPAPTQSDLIETHLESTPDDEALRLRGQNGFVPDEAGPVPVDVESPRLDGELNFEQLLKQP